MCEIDLPQKKNYRQRAHSNPVADHIFDYPLTPDEFNWLELLPAFKSGTDKVTIVDVGCGYGGLCITLSEMFPDQFIVGLEIRVKVSDYTKSRILALRSKHIPLFQNVCCIRTNAMKYLPNYFNKHQIEKMFFLYPDPHFKTNKHKWRIISDNLLTEYAYILAPKAIVYTLTDVEDLHNWIVDHFTKHPLFQRIDENGQMDDDPIVKKILVEDCSEEGKKVSRNQGNKFLAVFKRL